MKYFFSDGDENRLTNYIISKNRKLFDTIGIFLVFANKRAVDTTVYCLLPIASLIAHTVSYAKVLNIAKR